MENNSQIGDSANLQIDKLAETKAYLNREFLLWIWYLAEESPDFTVKDSENDMQFKAHLWVDNKLGFAANNDESQETILKGGNPSQSREAIIGLVAGKGIKELRIGMNLDGIGDFFATLSSKDLAPRSLKLPADSREEPFEFGFQSRTETNLYLVDLFMSAFDRLYGDFLAIRVTDEWKKLAQNLKKWIARRQSHMLEKTIH